jgi:hypothetical protein
VRKIAIGSLEPLSTSRVALSRSGSWMPPLRSTANTAAASVEPTMLPSSNPCSSGSPSTQLAARPVIREVSSTPRVARERAGRQHTRTASREVRRPPSNRIRARATLAALLARA